MWDFQFGPTLTSPQKKKLYKRNDKMGQAEVPKKKQIKK